MEHWRFVMAAKMLKLPWGNYIFRSKKTKVVYWFMVAEDYDRTPKMTYKPGSFDYDVTVHAMNALRAVDNGKWHQKLLKTMKGLKK